MAMPNKEILVVFGLAIVAGLATTMASPVAGISGTATFYRPPYTPSACYGYKEPAKGTTMIAAASEVFWNDKAACGHKYVVTCTGATNQMPHPCTGRSVTVKIVDLCPHPCNGTIDLSQEAFAVIANPHAGKIKIKYTKV